ncbi:adenosylmethionine decarboxylase [Lewinellaceae bacterium SD302]|nr:adenosylmethionine decarboxylase [Lewinellaceae bacterium SD302]
MNPDKKWLGTHVLLELSGCPSNLLTTPADSERILLTAAMAMRATVIESRFHAFSPHGVSGVIVIAESHLTIHTWPEHNYAAVDIFSCGDLNLQAGIELLTRSFKAESVTRRIINRGPK